MNVAAPKRKKLLSLRKAARELGVHYSHLRRVLRGERRSELLLQRYLSLPDANKNMVNPRFQISAAEAGAPAKPLFDAADCNTNHEWALLCSKLGFEFVCVQVADAHRGQVEALMGEMVGEELTKARLGHCDSTAWHPRLRHFFYCDRARLIDALELIKTSLANFNALPYCAIAHYDVKAAVWRGFYPSFK